MIIKIKEKRSKYERFVSCDFTDILQLVVDGDDTERRVKVGHLIMEELSELLMGQHFWQ